MSEGLQLLPPIHFFVSATRSLELQAFLLLLYIDWEITVGVLLLQYFLSTGWDHNRLGCPPAPGPVGGALRDPTKAGIPPKVSSQDPSLECPNEGRLHSPRPSPFQVRTVRRKTLVRIHCLD
jgi:hypothetical protein